MNNKLTIFRNGNQIAEFFYSKNMLMVTFFIEMLRYLEKKDNYELNYSEVELLNN